MMAAALTALFCYLGFQHGLFLAMVVHAACSCMYSLACVAVCIQLSDYGGFPKLLLIRLLLLVLLALLTVLQPVGLRNH